MNALRNALRQARERKGLSQNELAKLSGVSQQTISKYELGSVSPSPDQAAKIAKVLDIPEEDIFKVFYNKSR